MVQWLAPPWLLNTKQFPSQTTREVVYGSSGRLFNTVEYLGRILDMYPLDGEAINYMYKKTGLLPARFSGIGGGVVAWDKKGLDSSLLLTTSGWKGRKIVREYHKMSQYAGGMSPQPNDVLIGKAATAIDALRRRLYQIGVQLKALGH